MTETRPLLSEWLPLRDDCRAHIEQARQGLDQAGASPSAVRLDLMFALSNLATAWLVRHGLHFTSLVKETFPALRRFARAESVAAFDALWAEVRAIDAPNPDSFQRELTLRERDPAWAASVEGVIERLHCFFERMLGEAGESPLQGRCIRQGALHGDLSQLGPCLWLFVELLQPVRYGQDAPLPGLFQLGKRRDARARESVQCGLILPIERCADAGLAEILLAVLAQFESRSAESVRPLPPALLESANRMLAPARWQALDVLFSGQVIELALEPDSFNRLLPQFQYIESIADRPGQPSCPGAFADFAWRSQGELLEWLYQGLGRPTRLPCFSLALLSELRPVPLHGSYDGASTALAALPLWPASMIELRPAESLIEPIEVKAELLEHGWGRLRLTGKTGSVEVKLSYVFDPLPELIGWLDDIGQGRLPAGIMIDEEGPEKLLLARAIDEENLLIQVRGPEYEGFQAFLEVPVNRSDWLARLGRGLEEFLIQIEAEADNGRYWVDTDSSQEEYVAMFRALLIGTAYLPPR